MRTVKTQTVMGLGFVVSVALCLPATASPLGTAFTYQGRLKSAGQPLNGSANLVFKLYDADSAGNLLATQMLNGVAVSGGLFTVALNAAGEFGVKAFNGESRWLEISVNGTPLSPRQPITVAPYALGLAPGIMINGGANGLNSITLFHDDAFTNAIYAFQNAANGAAIYGEFDIGTGAKGLWGLTSDGIGVYGQSFGGAAGVGGDNTGGAGVKGTSSSTYGVYGISYAGVSGGAAGVYGVYSSMNNAGYLGTFSTGVPGEGASSGAVGVFGTAGPTGIGVYGYDGSHPGARAGPFFGEVSVVGNLTKSAGSFRIDHPLDPTNKYLQHSSVESPDMKNVYDGVVTTDANGDAVVSRPDYFEALNRDFRYHLTVIGEFAQAIVSKKIENNQFGIRTDKPNVEVSWQVTGIRQDPTANLHRTEVELTKPEKERGKYLVPEAYGLPADRAVNFPGGNGFAPSSADSAGVEAPTLSEDNAAPVGEPVAGALVPQASSLSLPSRGDVEVWQTEQAGMPAVQKRLQTKTAPDNSRQ